MENLEKRMYFLTMYNISSIQKSIQAGHAQMEYALKYWEDEDFQDWAKNHKTWIILNGGTSNHSPNYSDIGTMERYSFTLKQEEIKCAQFYEPDLNDSLSAIAFLVDERVFNKVDYPDLYDFMRKKIGIQEFARALTMRTDEDDCAGFKIKYPKEYGEWLYLIGGKKNAFLKEFLSNFKLA